MYKSFSVKNFRGFRDLTIESLERVNLISGMNNVGKTSLLEALFLHIGSHNPNLALGLNVFRGITKFKMDAEEIWGWLFFDKLTKETIELTNLDNNSEGHSLYVRLATPEETELAISDGDNNDRSAFSGSSSLTTNNNHRDLIFEEVDASGNRTLTRAYITSEGTIKSDPVQNRSFPPGIFLSTRARFPAEDAERFSELERVGQQDEILTTLQHIEPRLNRLAISISGRAAMIYGDIGLRELVPLQLMGEGTVRLLSIVLAIASTRQGIVLIDEIENGLHHSTMVKVWETIALAARKADVQVFATTHSWECIKAAHHAFDENGTYDFRLHRLERVKDDIQAVTYDRETLGTSVEMNLEVR